MPKAPTVNIPIPEIVGFAAPDPSDPPPPESQDPNGKPPRVSAKEVAQRYWAEECTHPDGPTLIRHRSDWWSWAPDTGWEYTSEEALGKTVYKWCKHNAPTANCNKHFREEALDHLGMQAWANDKWAIPFWVDDGPTTEPLIALRDVIVDLGALSRGETPWISNTPRFITTVFLPFTKADVQAIGGSPDHGCPKWLKILDRILEGDQDRINLLQEWFGYCLVPDTRETATLFLEGSGGNGKSVVIGVMEELLGDRNISHVELPNFGPGFHLQDTMGKLVNICGEAGLIPRVAEEGLKTFLDGGIIRSDRKYMKAIEFKATARLMVSVNSRPEFWDRSDGIFRRLRVMPFRTKIKDDEKDTLLKEHRHADWPLRDELPGIFRWAILGYMALRERGEFTNPKICQKTLKSYRTDLNPAWQFLDDNMEVNPDLSCAKTDLYADYKKWCLNSGYHHLGRNNLYKEVGNWSLHRKIPVTEARPSSWSGSRERKFVGIRPWRSKAAIDRPPAAQPSTTQGVA